MRDREGRGREGGRMLQVVDVQNVQWEIFRNYIYIKMLLFVQNLTYIIIQNQMQDS